ncbi:MAG: hypothetical protein QOH21_157, partial [Acidobacteriota bacterium]|nr:hypothetical protein [Acidobacteriota bacterium]
MICPKCNADRSAESCSQCAEANEAKAASPDEALRPPASPDVILQAQTTTEPGPGAAAHNNDEENQRLMPEVAKTPPLREPEERRKSTQEPEPPVVLSPSANVEFAQFHDFLMATGTNNKIIGQIVNNLHPADRPTLFDYLEEIPPPKNLDTSPVFDDAELDNASRALEKQRLLLLVCSDREAARTAGDALLARIKTPSRRLLTFNGLPLDVAVDVHALTRRAKRRNELLILVDAFEGERARNFVDSVFAVGAYGTDNLCGGLSRVRLRVACITSEDSIAGRIHRLGLEQWTVSSARILLRGKFPEDFKSIGARITEQRREGNWSRSPIEFRKQLEELIGNGELRSVIEKGGPLAYTSNAKPVEQAPAEDPDNVLNIAVLYTATFYPNLSAMEFADIVKLIVGDQHALVPENVQQKTKDGSFKMVELKRDKPIIDIWNARPDSVLRENRLITGRDAGRPIIFADVGRGDLLRRQLDEEYGSYVMGQFVMAWDKGLLFERSARIASAVTTLTIEMAINDPDQFGVDWLTGLILRFCEEGSDTKFVLRRASDLLRTMLRHSPLDRVVNDVVQRLLQLGNHHYAFTIV